MTDPDVLARKLLVLNETLQYLARPETHEEQQLAADPVLRAAAERWVQVAIERCIDMAFHVVSENGWAPPDTAKGAFVALSSHDVIEASLAARLGTAVGLRNVLVHDYAEVNLQLLTANLAAGLDDLRAFGGCIAELLAQADGG